MWEKKKHLKSDSRESFKMLSGINLAVSDPLESQILPSDRQHQQKQEKFHPPKKKFEKSSSL
jgi:hypothetical protein